MTSTLIHSPSIRSQNNGVSPKESYSEDSQNTEESPESYENGVVNEAASDRAESEDGVLSLDDLLQEKNARIKALERANRMKDETLQLLQQKLNETKVKQKEGIYWLQLELDSARRDHDATEEQMAELMNDLQGTTKISNPSDVSKDVLREEIIKNYELALAAMDNQITMIKTSAGEVVKTLKEDIADLMEDRASMEVDLLNQLAVLNNEKNMREEEYQDELKTKNDAIRRLLSAGGTAKTSSDTSDLEEYESEIGRLMDVQKKTQEKLSTVRDEANDEIQRLELANAQLKSDLERAEDDLAMFQSENNSEETIQALQLISREREDTIETLDRVAAVWEKADAAIIALEDSMDQLRPDNSIPVKGDREQLLATLETATLVHGQIKISLMLIEMKLRNQLQSLKNDTICAGRQISDESVIEQMKSIQADALNVLSQVEIKLAGQIREMEKNALEETKLMKNSLQQRSATLEAMKKEHEVLEKEITRLKSETGGPDTNNSKLTTDEGKSSSDRSGRSTILNGISKAIVDQLQLEVFRVLERVKEKNDLIRAMKVKMDEQKTIEEGLKKELKRALLKPPTPAKSQGSAKSAPDSPRRQSPRLSTTSAPTSPKATVYAISPQTMVPPFGQSPKTPVPRSPNKSRRRASEQIPIRSPNKVTSPIPMLKPSPREISKSRLSIGLASPEQMRLQQGVPLKSNSPN